MMQAPKESKQYHLQQIKKDVEEAYKSFVENYKRYQEYYIFVFKSSLSDAEISNLNLMGKPPLEFNILEAYISRLRGEFSKQQPQLDVHAAEGLTLGKIDDDYKKLLSVIQAHLNEIFFSADNDQFTYDIYSDTLAGGFSVAKVYTDYINDNSFLQKIKIERVSNPTLCGFDPLAKTSHKGDGNYCFEMFPMTQQEFAMEFGEARAQTFNFTRAIESFNWSYKNNDVKVVLVADYYCKVQKKKRLVRIAPNEYLPEMLLESDYNKAVKEWDRIEQIPPILDRRETVVTTIDLYRICQNEILEHHETNYPMLPLVFFDGNSVFVQDIHGGKITQMTRPYVYHAKGIQRLKNFAGQTIGQELEDMPRQTYMMPIEGMAKQYEKVYQNPQIASNIPYYQFNPKNTEQQLNAPSVVQRIPTPPLVYETYQGSDATTQAILGSYDAILGVNDKQISGVAIQQGAMQSNAAAVPYLMSYIKGLQRCAEIVIHLMPLFYNTPRTIPIRLPNGKRDYQVINSEYPKVNQQKQMLQKAQEQSMGNEIPMEEEESAEEEQMENAIDFNYDPREINVKIEPGVNARVAKQVAIDQLTAMMNASPVFAEFMNRQGLPTLLKNLDIHGGEALVDMAEQFQAQMQKEREQASQQGTDADKIAGAEIQKAMLEAEARKQKTQADFSLGIAKAAIMKEDAETKRLELELKAQEAHARLHMDRENQAAQAASDTVQLAFEVMKHQAEVNQQQQAGQQQSQQM